MSQDRDNEGAIWMNDKRESDRHPHFRGNATVNGVEYWVSAWKRDPDGNPKAPALKFKLTAKEQQSGGQDGGRNPAAQPAPQPPGDFDDDIPF